MSAASSYLSLDPSLRISEQHRVSDALAAFVDAAPVSAATLSEAQRREFAEAVIDDLDRATALRIEGAPSNTSSAWSLEVRLLALKALKELGRLSGGSAPIASSKGLRMLLRQVEVSAPLSLRSPANTAKSEAHTPDAVSSSNPGSPFSRAFKRPGTPNSMKSALLGRVGASGSRSSSPARPDSAADGVRSSGECISLDSASAAGADASWDVVDQALRCANNALYLHPEARSVFAGTDIKGGHLVIALLQDPSNTPADIIFLAGRLCFYLTLFEAPFNKIAVEQLHVVGTFASCLHALLTGIIPPTPAPTLLSPRDRRSPGNAQGSSSSSSVHNSAGGPIPGTQAQLYAALSELLKSLFNLGLYYPRMADDMGSGKAKEDRAVLGEAFHPAFESLLEPVIRIVVALPLASPAPLAPPVTNAVGVLLNYPVAPYSDTWLSTSELGLSPASARASGSGTGLGAAPPVEKAPSAAKRFSQGVSNLLSGGKFSSDSSSSSGSPLTSSFSSSSAHLRGTSSGSGADEVVSSPLLAKLVLLLDKMCARYLPAGDPDEKGVKAHAAAEGADLEDTLQPLALLLRKLAAEEPRARAVLKRAILPEDIDRTVALDKRTDLTGRLIRLMSSVMLPRLARASGELLLAICESDPKIMTSEIGYGPCAGFLMSLNLSGGMPTSSRPAPTSPASGSASTNNTGSKGASASASAAASGPGRTINPVTGQFDPTPAELASDPINALSDSEKEREAEKLFALFDRINRTGVISVKNPMQAAAEEGRFEEIDAKVEEEERRAREEEEERDEREVGKMMEERRRKMEKAREERRKEGEGEREREKAGT